jgi:hypothetical protein
VEPADPHTIETWVLEDATGRRRRRMRLLGRAVSLLFLLWLVVIVLGGIGVAPVGHVPLVRALHPSQGPPAVRTLPTPTSPSPSDLRPALPEAALPPPHPAVRVRKSLAHPPGRSSLAPGRNKTGTIRGRSSLAPGHTRTKPDRGRSSSAPGHTKTTATVSTTTTHRPTHRRRP